MNNRQLYHLIVFSLVILALGQWSMLEAAQGKALTYQDIMRFKQIQNPVISEDGKWVAYALQPDRGDGEVRIFGLENEKEYSVDRGSRPVFTKNAAWVAMIVKPKAVDLEKASKEKPKPGLALLHTQSGDISRFEKVQAYLLSDDSRWLAFLHHKEEEKKDEKGSAKEESTEMESKRKPEKVGSTLILIDLESEEEIQIPHVLYFGFDSASNFLAFVLAEPEGLTNGLFYIKLGEEGWARKTIMQREMAHISQLTWTKAGSKLGFIFNAWQEEEQKEEDVSIWIWDGSRDRLTQAVKTEDAAPSWYLPEKNSLYWSKDGKRLFFGFKPELLRIKAEKEKAEEEDIDLFDVDRLLAKSEVDVWHWDDPYINTHQKNIWPRIKDQTFLAVFHTDSGRIIPLADLDMPQVRTNDNANYGLGLLDAPYRKQVTWYGRLNDLYLVNLKNGSRTMVASELEDRSALSPGGRYVVFYKDKHWFLFDRRSGNTRNLTADLDVPFFNEDHDYPQKVPSYGIAGWMGLDRAVFIYDKYDIWSFPLRSGQPRNITGGKGRIDSYTFRILRLDPEKEYYQENETLLLSAYHNDAKNWGFYKCGIGNASIEKRLEENKKFTFRAKAKKADVVLYTRESYEEFPDLWVSGQDFSSPTKVSDANPQIKDYAWGSAELVEWKSVDGIPLQGVLIKPGMYEPGKKYPVIVYYYRFFSQRLHEFNQTVINHRPNFPFYASNGYAVFLPDIRFDVGLPGPAATKCLVPGVQKLIDMGIADPKAIGLHGHSWSGYQTAFVVTQTNIFACAIAGAPVSNMTSAYSGIRWGSGLARQFQYEKSQSRIGGSLWEKRDLYIENSPVFFADRIQTPLLIIFGDEDGAVPWYQGIELYLAMRRLEKDCIFLQYRGEPHHPQKYPNKLDWFHKMKEYFDHYLKGKSGPDWITKGILYRGK